ncbi:hypothetical protein AKJ18_25125, partial [Vibrio xuii]
AGLRNGHVYFERRCGLQFEINQGQLIPGQDSQGQALDYALSVTDTSKDYLAEVVVDGEVTARVPLSQTPTPIHVEQGYLWCRIDIRRTQSDAERGELEGCINAVFNGNQSIFNTPLVNTWGELMEQLNSDEV